MGASSRQWIAGYPRLKLSMNNSKFVLLYCWSKEEPTHIEKYAFPIVRETKTKYFFSDGTAIMKRIIGTSHTTYSLQTNSDFFVGKTEEEASALGFRRYPIVLIRFLSDTEDNAECDRKAKELFLSKQIPAKICSIESQQKKLEKELKQLEKEQKEYENVANTGDVKFQTVSPFRTDVAPNVKLYY